MRRIGDVEFIVVPLSNGKYLCAAFKQGKIFGMVNEYTYEQAYAWFRLMIGYGDTYKGAA